MTVTRWFFPEQYGRWELRSTERPKGWIVVATQREYEHRDFVEDLPHSRLWLGLWPSQDEAMTAGIALVEEALPDTDPTGIYAMLRMLGFRSGWEAGSGAGLWVPPLIGV